MARRGVAAPGKHHQEHANVTLSRRMKGSSGRNPGGGDTAPQFDSCPLAVVDVEDEQVLAYCTGGLVLDVPAKSIPALGSVSLTICRPGRLRMVHGGAVRIPPEGGL
ncbi:transcriptional regulatory protein [Streptomyces sp. SPB074]|nr:transcriptional regulatory protein [Streptomyces sp. SPB074]